MLPTMQMDHGVAAAAGRLASGLRWNSLKQSAIRMLIDDRHSVAAELVGCGAGYLADCHVLNPFTL